MGASGTALRPARWPSSRQQTQLTTQAATLAHVGQWLRYQLSGLVGLTVLVLALGGLVGWQLGHPPAQGYARALGALDQAVVQAWPQMPKAVQEQLSATYGRLGLVPPGPRKEARPLARRAPLAPLAPYVALREH